mgnify:CR=1 FL=1
MNRIRSAALTGMTALVVACGRAPVRAPPATPGAAPPLVEPVSTESTGAPAPRLPALGFADIASEPIHVWVGRGEDQVIERIISVGHAEPDCCRTISDLEANVVILGAVTGERYHGFTDVRLNERMDSIFAMQGLLAVTEQTRGAEAECVRQIHVHAFRTIDHEARSAQIRDDAARAYALASSLARPIMVWNDNLDGAPQWVPVLVPGPDGGLRPLTLEFGLHELDLPKALYHQPPALQSELREAEATLARTRNLARIYDDLRRVARRQRDTVLSSERVKIAGPEIPAKLSEIRGYAQCIERERERWDRLARAVRDFQIEDSRPANALRELDRMLADNRKTTAQLERLGAQGVADFAIQRCEEATVELPSAERRKLLRLDTRPILAKLERKLAYWRSLGDRMRQDAVGTLLDSGLRGLNIGFEEADEAKLYDAWMIERQIPLWLKIRTQAAAQGVSFGSPDAPAGVLNASNLILRSERTGDRIRLTPHFVLHGPFYQVADPEARLVYYESSTAEHNLGDPRRQEVTP